LFHFSRSAADISLSILCRMMEGLHQTAQNSRSLTESHSKVFSQCHGSLSVLLSSSA
jgi:hypothetical protein